MSDTPLARIATFWTGAPLSYVERLCLHSFVDMGHPITLYSYETIEGVPAGVEERDAREILPEPEIYITHARTGSPAPHADRFRYHLLRQRPGVIWADTDAYCLAPFVPKDGYYVGFGNAASSQVANGVLALPPDSEALQTLIDYTSNEYAVLPWLPEQQLGDACRRALDGDPMHVTEMPWGVWGPSALTWAMRRSREIRNALPSDVLYPVLYEDRRRFFRRAALLRHHLSERSTSIHLYGRRVRTRLIEHHGDVPPPGTILHHLGLKHGLAT